MEVVIDMGNEAAVRWFQNYINDQAHCDDDTSVQCFTVYCKIGDGIDDEDFSQDWLDYEDFQDYIDDVIKEGTNANGGDGTKANSYYWGNVRNGGKNEFKDALDVDDWVKDLCGGLT